MEEEDEGWLAGAGEGRAMGTWKPWVLAILALVAILAPVVQMVVLSSDVEMELQGVVVMLGWIQRWRVAAMARW